jgi:hypothetical protein
MERSATRSGSAAAPARYEKRAAHSCAMLPVAMVLLWL